MQIVTRSVFSASGAASHRPAASIKNQLKCGDCAAPRRRIFSSGCQHGLSNRAATVGVAPALDGLHLNAIMLSNVSQSAPRELRMSKRPPVAKSELEVAQIVWQLGEASVRQVLESLPAERRLDFKTVQTYLRRLEAKGYLRSRSEGRAKVYVPRVPPRSGCSRVDQRSGPSAVRWPIAAAVPTSDSRPGSDATRTRSVAHHVGRARKNLTTLFTSRGHSAAQGVTR